MNSDIDIQRLSQKAAFIQALEGPLSSTRRAIEQLNAARRRKLEEAQLELERNDIDPGVINNDIYIEGHSIEKAGRRERRIKVPNSQSYSPSPENKNPGVGDMDKMLFDKKFKNYLNHKQEFAEKARQRQMAIRERRRKLQEGLEEADDYFNQEEVLSNTGSDYQYRDAEDMQAAYETLATGKRKKKGVQLFFAEKFEFGFRFAEFQYLLSESEDPTKGLISKEQLLNYLFDEPMVMMLYSVNPYLLADEITEYETQVPSMLCFQEFSCFLLLDREPTYFEYTQENLDEARRIGRGLKCLPIVGKWIDDSGIYEELMQIFTSVDMFGNGSVERAILTKKMTLQCEKKRLLDQQVVQIVNVNKLVTVSRLIYELEHSVQENPSITRAEFEEFLQHYYRRPTPEKDKLITKLIMAGKFDTSYIYIVSGEVLDFIKDVFGQMEKFAEYFVRKEKFVEKVYKNPKFKKLKTVNVRSEGNRYVVKETVEEVLARMLKEADEYIDIEDILDFFTNRGRPRIVEYKVYLANLQRQLAQIEEEERLRWEKIQEGEEPSTSSDEQFAQQIKRKRIQRKKQKLQDIHNSMKYENKKKFNLTIPIGFAFDQRDRTKKVSIRQKKLKEMLEEKRLKQDEAMKPIPVKEVPKHVKENLYERIMKDQERERLERLEKFRAEIKESMVPMSDRLTRPKSTTIHCEFGSKPYEFVARPMPWYCEVNLMDRINKKKAERRERILEQIINRNHDNDLPEGVVRMLERHDQLEKKRAAKGTVSTFSGPDLTFIPKISHYIPDFKAIHENLNIDLDIARENKKHVHPAPFSFEYREHRSRTTHDGCIPKLSDHRPLSHSREYAGVDNKSAADIKWTLKHKGLVEKRQEERDKKREEQEKQQRNEQKRKLRQMMFAPQVRRALKKNENLLSKSRNQMVQRLRQFQRDERRKKREHEEAMIQMYAKTWNKPLLIETMAGGEHQAEKQPELPKREHDAQRKATNSDYQEKRRRAVQVPPGQYLMEQDYEPGMMQHGGEEEFYQGEEQEYDDEGDYFDRQREEYLQNGPLHTS